MTRTLPKKSRRDFEGLAWFGVLYVLVPGLVLGSLAESATSGLNIGSVLPSLFLGLGGPFVAATHLIAAEKVGARFLIPVIGVVSVLVGLLFLGYGISVFLGAHAGLSATTVGQLKYIRS